MTLQTILEFIAALCGALFAGAAVYINVVEHPARMCCGVEVAATEWAPSYKRATWMQAPLAVIGFLCTVITWLSGSGVLWLIGGLSLGLVVPLRWSSPSPRTTASWHQISISHRPTRDSF